MLEYLNALEKLTSIFSVERLTAQRRRRIARALVELHDNLELVVRNARLILKHKPDDLGVVHVDVSLLERQVGTLAETRRLLSTAPLRSVLRIKWKPWPRFCVLSEGKGYALALALGAFYGLVPEARAEAQMNELYYSPIPSREPEGPRVGWSLRCRRRPCVYGRGLSRGKGRRAGRGLRHPSALSPSTPPSSRTHQAKRKAAAIHCSGVRGRGPSLSYPAA